MSRVVTVARGRNGAAPQRVTVVDEFCAKLSASDSRTVRHTVEEIGRLQRQVAVNALGIGDALYKLRTAIGSQEFHGFIRDVLPKFGMSRSTAYRWLSFSERLVPLFPNPTVRQYLMAFTDGKGIVMSAKSEGAGDVHLGLTPAAENALKSLPSPPTGKTEIAACEEWVRQFIRETRKARSEARSKPKDPAEARAAIIDMFIRFADRYGLQAAEDLCGDLDKTLTQLVDESSANASKPHRVYELGIKPAHSGSGTGQQPFSPILARQVGNSLT